jgi:hypothetical protein
MKTSGSISIWFFTGISLLINGLLILGTGLFELAHPPATPVVLSDLHAPIWWGALMTILGAFYTLHYKPSKHQV